VPSVRKLLVIENFVKYNSNKTKDIRKAVDDSLAMGWEMRKLIQSSRYHNDDVFDYRTVYNRKDLFRLTSEGFILWENSGLLALNILLKI
jgi:hypothetical protein